MGPEFPSQGADSERRYAIEQVQRAWSYLREPSGNRLASLARAISCFEEALRFFTADTAPAQHAAIMLDLGNAYLGFRAGDRAVVLARAIECFEDALRFFTAEANPFHYAAAQVGIGAALHQLLDDTGDGDRAARLARMIACFTEALRFFTADAAPAQYAQIQHNMGAAFAFLPTGDREADLARAIGCFTEALRFRTAEAAPAAYAQTQHSLGNVYLKLPTGDREADLARAIGCYTEALRFRTAESAGAEYAATEHMLGNAYSQEPTGDLAADLARAIGCYTRALSIFTADDTPLDWAAVQSSLGGAYQRLPTGDPDANRAQAITCFTKALTIYTADTAPAEYAPTQYNLGRAYEELQPGDPGSLARAIACFTEALRVYTAEAFPLEFAATQVSLGILYSRLTTGDRTANLARAITCYNEALRIRTAEASPDDYAKIQHNMGTAYADLRTRDRSASLTRAITCYAEALRFRTPEVNPADYALTQHSLGVAYADFPAIDIPATLARAIGCYHEALRFRTEEADPAGYAQAMTGLGAAYARLTTGGLAANQTRAIACFTEALRFYPAQTAPAEYAMIQHNLGVAYAERHGGDRPADLAQAIAYFTEALRFRTAEAVPAECRLTARRLGHAYFEQARWTEAHTAYALAIRAGDLLYQATGSEVGRQIELEATRDVVPADAYCLARLGQLDEAMEQLEAGRARALSEALARDRTRLRDASEADRAAFIEAADRVSALNAQGRRGRDIDVIADQAGRSYAEQSADLARARDDLAVVIAQIRGYLPDFTDEGLSYQAIAASAAAARPVVYLLTTRRGSLALLALAGMEHPAPEHALWLDDFTTAELWDLLVQRDPTGNPGGYGIGQVDGELGQIEAALTAITEILRRELTGPLAERLANLGLASATVIPVGLLSLLPLPASAPDNCTIALAPSARALSAGRRALRQRAREAPVLLAVSNPLPLPAGAAPLRYARVEVSAIERFFAGTSRRTLPEESATPAAVAECLPGATHLHLACHGRFDSDEPLDSAVYLSAGQRLTLRDVLDGNLDLSSLRLAVLSACQTGISDVIKTPDEVVGLPAGFMQAGVPGVVATLWPVFDRSTAVLVGEFYRLLLDESHDPATALHQACRHLRDATARDLAEWFERRHDDSGGTDLTAGKAAAALRSHPDPADRPYADPVYWAGFVYSGP